MNVKTTLLSCLAIGAGGMVRADDPPRDKPLPIPLTRPEMKQALEDLKERTPRFVLPAADGSGKGRRGRTRPELRKPAPHALPRRKRCPRRRRGRSDAAVERGGGGSRTEDPNQTLPYAFKTQLFWIVSRTNNCLY